MVGLREAAMASKVLGLSTVLFGTALTLACIAWGFDIHTERFPSVFRIMIGLTLATIPAGVMAYLVCRDNDSKGTK